MKLFKVENKKDRYGELVLTGDNGEVLYDIVYDGKGYHNYYHRLAGDFKMVETELSTYGGEAMLDYLEHLKNYYNIQVREA